MEAHVTVYYVKNGGSDGADGLTDATAWATYGKANSVATTGDTVLGKRGSRFAEVCTVPAGTMTYDAYGTGDAPVFDGTTSPGSMSGGPNIWTNDTTLAGLWMTDEASSASRLDSTSNGNTLTDTNGVVKSTTTPRLPGFSASFTGASNQKLSCTDANLAAGFPCKGNANATVVTYGLWFRCSTLPAGGSRSYLINKGTAYNIYIDGTTAKLVCQTYNGGGFPSVFSDSAISANTWYHVVARIDTGTGLMHLFVNGTKQAGSASSITGISGDATQDFILGMDWFDTAWNYTGLATDAFVYARALTDNEISNISQRPVLHALLANAAGTHQTSRASLAASGDWCWGAGTLFQYAASAPSSSIVVLTATPGFTGQVVCVDKSGVALNNLTVVGSPDVGIMFPANGVAITSLTIRNCRVTDCATHGIFAIGNTFQISGGLVDHCDVARVGFHGIQFSLAVSGSTVNECTVSDAGLAPLATGSYQGGYHGITQYSNNGSYVPNGNTVSKCTVTRTARCLNGASTEGNGIQCDDRTTNATVSECLSYGNGGGGFVVNSNTNNTVLRCRSTGNTDNGFAVTGSTTGNVFYHCVAWGNVLAGYFFSNNMTVKNCISVDNGTTSAVEFDAYNASTIVADYNCIYHTAGGSFMTFNASVYGWAGYKTASGQDASSLNNDPLLAVGGSGELQGTSPCIDRAVYLPGINEGFVGGRPDIGAFEFDRGRARRLPRAVVWSGRY